MNEKISIKQGTKHWIDVPKADLPTQPTGVTWKAALYNRATDKRYVANSSSQNPTYHHFEWPAGVTVSAGQPIAIDPTVKNGTASMDEGVYDLELYTSDFANIATQVNYAEVTQCNIMAKNTGDQPEVES